MKMQAGAPGDDRGTEVVADVLEADDLSESTAQGGSCGGRGGEVAFDVVGST